MTGGNESGKGVICAGYVMAGGGSTRFGRDKALADFDGKPLLLRMADLVREVLGNVTLVAPANRYDLLAICSISDQWPGEGPLGGIVTALEDSSSRNPQPAWNLIVSCDMPFLTADWLSHLAATASASSAEAVIPRSSHGLEPLCACWRTDAAPKLRQTFARGTRKITDALKLLRTEVLDETHWKRFDNAERLFWNMNTVADYEEARKLLAVQKK